MITALCVLKSGGEYDASHVIRLQEQLQEHAPEWKFVCLSDVALPCDTEPLTHDWPGWWSKLELFRFEPAKGEAVVYLDLDSTVQSYPWRLAKLAHSAPWSILRDVYRTHGLQSSVMTWSSDALAPVYELARTRHAEILGRLRGDQDWIEECVHGGDIPSPALIQSDAPGACLSWKADHKRDGKPLGGAEVVFYHGRPRPWEVE